MTSKRIWWCEDQMAAGFEEWETCLVHTASGMDCGWKWLFKAEAPDSPNEGEPNQVGESER